MKKAAAAAVLALAAAGAVALLLRPSAPTFAKEVGPLVRARCAGCHRPGGGAPFALLDYADVKARAEQIAEATRRRLMPPWMPEPGEHAFLRDRSLPAVEIALLGRWAAAGAPEGEPQRDRLPPPPAAGLDREDLVVQLPAPYVLAAGGPEVYRNFVIPVPLDGPRHVHAWEFRPGAANAVHHAFLFLDRSGESRRLDAEDAEPGFPGLHVPRGAGAPAGHFMSWQPGAEARRSGDFPWTLEPGTALVVQAHLRPTGKPEEVRPSVAFTFGGPPAGRQPVKFGLWAQDIDIPAGAAEHAVRDSFTLPADVDVLGLLPHAHFLARRVEARATRPDGTSTLLLRIPRWNFDWQGDYAYRDPVFLPKGTTVSLEVVYDNTAENPRNPNRPPRRVRYGIESGDEMAELMLRALPREPDGAARIEQAMVPKLLASTLAYNRYLLERDPANGRARAELGKALVLAGRLDEAEPHLEAAARMRPGDDEPLYYLGIAERRRGRPAEALVRFREALQRNPSNARAHGNAGLVLLERGDLDAAAAAFEAALRLDPADGLARECLADIARRRAK